MMSNNSSGFKLSLIELWALVYDFMLWSSKGRLKHRLAPVGSSVPLASCPTMGCDSRKVDT